MPRSVSHHSWTAPIRPSRARTSRRWSRKVAAVAAEFGGEQAQQSAEDALGARAAVVHLKAPRCRWSWRPRGRASGAAEQGLAPGQRERVLEPRRFGARDLAAEGGERVGAA